MKMSPINSHVSLQTLTMPSVGIGSWQSEKGEVGRAVEWALEAGVRLIDTAAVYQNEGEIGEVLKRWLDSGRIKREEIFVVTKLPFWGLKEKAVESYLRHSLKLLNLEYVDLYLVHTPIGAKDDGKGFVKLVNGKGFWDPDTDLPSVWRGMESCFDLGLARSLGVSNWNSEQLTRVSKTARVPIAVNQVECHAHFQQRKLRETMRELGVKMMAYAPLGSPGRAETQADRGGVTIPSVLSDPMVIALSKKYSKTPAQILLRHLTQLGIVVIPKSVKQHRIKENFDVLDFELSLEDMRSMAGIDKGSKSRTFAMGFLPTDDDATKLKEYPIIPQDEY